VKSTLIILTYNEIEGVEALFDKIPFREIDEVIVVDGGSMDGTIEFFKTHGVKVIIQESRGRGEAFRIARKESLGDYLVFFSPDGNEDPNDIPKLISKLKEGYDMVIASRFKEGSHNEEDELLFPWRAWANRIFTMLANILWNKNQYITDTINGFRAVTKEAFDKMKIDAPGFVIEYQISIRAMKLNLKVAEIPTYEDNRIGGESTAKSISTGILFVRFLLKELFLGKNFMEHR
jgi:glycosyltransferase involved in cell wall biosynthesis